MCVWKVSQVVSGRASKNAHERACERACKDLVMQGLGRERAPLATLFYLLTYF